MLVNRVQPFPRVRYSQQALHNDLRRLQKAWRAYQESRRRDAIYEFLGCVLEILAIWTVDNSASGRSRQALALSGAPTPAANEPFVLLITAAAHPHRVDERTLSKWTRVLQFAAEHKLPSTPLEAFAKRYGGINNCAAKFTRRVRKRSKQQPRFTAV